MTSELGHDIAPRLGDLDRADAVAAGRQRFRSDLGRLSRLRGDDAAAPW